MNSYNFSISNDLTHIFKSPTWITIFKSPHSPALLSLLLSSDTSICSTVTFHQLGNADPVATQFQSLFNRSLNSKRNAPFNYVACGYSCANDNGPCDCLREAPWEDIFKLSASAAAASGFCWWFQDEIEVYTSYCKYQVERHSSPWFPDAGAPAIIHSSSESNIKFMWASNCSKSFRSCQNLPMLIKKGSITFQKLGSRILESNVLDEGKTVVITLFNGPEVLSSASDKTTLSAKSLSKNSNLDGSGTSSPVSFYN